LLATVAGSSAFDILRRSKSDLLMTGNVPSIGVQGILLATVAIALPLAALSVLNGAAGWILSIVSSLLMAWIAFRLALHSFQRTNA